MDWAAIGVGVGYASVALSILVFRRRMHRTVHLVRPPVADTSTKW